MTDYSELNGEPGYNVTEIMPGGSLLKLPFPYKEIGYEKAGFKKTLVKKFVELWGEPDRHVYPAEYYANVWKYYERNYKKNKEGFVKE
jgi:hypothetical protein